MQKIDHGLTRRIGPSGSGTCGASPDLLLASPAGTTTWRCTTAGTRAPPCWGSSAGRSRRLPSSPAANSCSSSSCPTTRLTGRGSPCDTRSSKQVGGALTNRKSAVTSWRGGVTVDHSYNGVFEGGVFEGACSRLSRQSELDLQRRVKQKQGVPDGADLHKHGWLREGTSLPCPTSVFLPPLEST